MSTIEISILTEYVEKQRNSSTSRKRLKRLKDAGLLQKNGELNPEFYTESVIKAYKNSNFNMTKNNRNFKLIQERMRENVKIKHKISMPVLLNSNYIKNED